MRLVYIICEITLFLAKFNLIRGSEARVNILLNGFVNI